MLVRDAAPVQFALVLSLKLVTIIRPYALDRQLLRGYIVCNQIQESGRCVTFLLNELYHLEAGAVVHENDDLAVPAETRVLHRPARVDKEPLSFHARPFVRLLWHGLSLRLSLEARFACPPLARRLDPHQIGCLSRNILARVRKYAMDLHNVTGYPRSHRQRRSILTNPFSVKFASSATSCLGVRLAPVAENSLLRRQNLKTSDSSPGTPKRLLSYSRLMVSPIAPLLWW